MYIDEICENRVVRLNMFVYPSVHLSACGYTAETHVSTYSFLWEDVTTDDCHKLIQQQCRISSFFLSFSFLCYPGLLSNPPSLNKEKKIWRQTGDRSSNSLHSVKRKRDKISSKGMAKELSMKRLLFFNIFIFRI